MQSFLDYSDYPVAKKDSIHNANLYEVQQRLEAIINTALDGIITIDEKGIIESINEAGADIFGYKREELLGLNISLLMSSPHKTRHDEYIDNYIRTGKAKIIGTKREETGRKKDGTLFPIRLAVSEIKLDDGKRIFTGIIHDLTDEKKNEEAIIHINMELENQVASQTFELKMAVEKLLEANSKLEDEIKEKTRMESILLRNREKLEEALEKEKELNEMKSRFVSMTSHEFRTPLSTIFSSASIIDRYKMADEQDNREKHTRKIKKSVTMLINILDEFLNMTRLEKDVVLVRNSHSKYDLNEFIKSIADELESILKKDQLIKLEQDGNVEVFFDQSIFKQIIYNILSNAIKYSGEGSTITISSQHKEDKFLVLSIKDEGIGIPYEEQKHLFTRFFRASNSTHIQGTGLGLYLVLHYLNLLNGRISFESEANKGTTFSVEIPF